MNRVIEGLVTPIWESVREAIAGWESAAEWGGMAFVLDVAVKGMLIVAIAGLAAFALRRSSAAVRHFVWTLAAAALLALPLLTLAVPAWRVTVPGVPTMWIRGPHRIADHVVVVEPAADVVVVKRLRHRVRDRVIVIPGNSRDAIVEVVPVPPSPPAPPVPPAPPRQPRVRSVPLPPRPPSPSYAPRRESETAAERVDRLLRERERLRNRQRTGTELSDAGVVAGARGLASARAPKSSASKPAASARSDDSAPPPAAPAAALAWPVLLIGIWITGCLLVAGSIALGMARIRLLERRAWRVERGWPVPALRRIARELGIVRPVTMLEGDTGTMPMTWGTLRPVILLPAAAATWPAARVEAVLRHELAHVRRLDSLTQMVAEIACAIHWFNPMVWLVVRRMRIEREMACDDHVLAAGSVPSAYAAELVALARSLRPHPTSRAAIAMAQPNQLKGRVQALLEERRRGGVPVSKALAAAVIALLFVVPLAAMAPEPLRRVASGAEAVDVTPSPGVTRVPLLILPGWRVGSPMAPISAPEFLAGAAVGAIEPRVAPIAKRNVRIADVPRTARAIARKPQAPQTLCWAQSTGARNTSVNRNDADYRLTWRSASCAVEIRIRGDVRFRPDFSDVASISSGGSMVLTEDAGARERRLVMRPGPEGIEYQWSVDGGQGVYDPVAREWLRAMLLHFTRTTGYGASERIQWILEQQGLAGLMQEIEYLRGDYVRRLYYRAALEQSGMDASRAAELLRSASTKMSSDHELALLLMTAGQRFEFDPALRDAFIAASRTLQSDHERRRALATVLEKSSLDAATAATLLASVQEMSSDHEKSMLLMAFASRYPMEPLVRTEYLRAATAISSDYEKRRVLSAVIAKGALEAAELALLLDAAGTIRSDHESAALLRSLAATDLSNPELQAAYLRAASTLQSDFELRRVLSGIVGTERMAPEVLTMVLHSAQSLESDHELAELLLQIVRTQTLDGAQHELFLRALDTIQSQHDHGRVSSALLRSTARRSI